MGKSNNMNSRLSEEAENIQLIDLHKNFYASYFIGLDFSDSFWEWKTVINI